MTTTINLSHSWELGLAPDVFMDTMQKNQQAFRDWYDRFTWENNEIQAAFSSWRSGQHIRCLILAAEWCGDVVRNVPAVFRMLEEANIPVRVLIMEDHLDIMDRFLTMGGRAIPIVLFINTDGNVIGKWGPRPAHVQEIMIAFKQENPDRTAPDYDEKIKDARARMLKAYGEDASYQHVIARELYDVLKNL